jgi:hypothetical protein
MQGELILEAPNPKNRKSHSTSLTIIRYQRVSSKETAAPSRSPTTQTERSYSRIHQSLCGIDQAMFPDLLETSNLASQSSPWLNAINVVSIAFTHFPTGVSQASSLALMLTVQVAKNMQSRHRYGFLTPDRLSKLFDNFLPM